MEATGERYQEAELRRLRVMLEAVEPNADRLAEVAALDRAAEVARAQGGDAWSRRIAQTRVRLSGRA